MSFDSYLGWTFLGIILSALVTLPLFFILLRGQRKYPLFLDDHYTAQLFYKISKSIRSCSTFQELSTCSIWMQKVEFQLPPWSLTVLKAEWDEKEKEIEENMFIMMSGSLRGVQ